MLGSVAKRERRSLWATVSLLLALGIGGCVFLAGSERSGATEAAQEEALLAGEQLGSMVTKKDLARPVTGARHARLAGDIRAITARGPVEAVIIWSPQARVLFAADESLVGSRVSSMRGLVARVAEGSPQSRVRAGTLQTFLPMWPSSRGAVAVAEMDQPAQAIAAAGGTWSLLKTTLTLALVATLLLFVLTLLPRRLPRLTFGRKRTATSNGRPQPDEGHRGPFWSRLPRREPAPADDSSPAYMNPGFRQVEEARKAAEERARATEQDFHGLQSRFERSIEQVKVLEGRAQAEDATGQRLRDMEARLQAAEARIRELEAALARSAPGAPASQFPTTEQVR